VTQVPVGTGGLLLSTRYPAGTSFTIKRVFRWFPQLNAQLWRASSVAEVQRADGQAYHFDGRWLTLKVTDPGDPASKALEWLGISIQHARWYNLHYKVEASCAANDGTFCSVATPAGRQSPPVAADYVLFEGESCEDVPAPGAYTCAQQAQWGKCDEAWMSSYCAKTCGRCDSSCTNIAPDKYPRCDEPSMLSRCGHGWIQEGGFCKLSCGRCSVDALLPCENRQPAGDTTCADVLRMGSCGASWVRDNKLCQATCGSCPSGDDSDSSCHDISPNSDNSCADYLRWGACSKDWMRNGEWCLKSCGRCPDASTRSGGALPLPSPLSQAPSLYCDGPEAVPMNGMTCEEVAANGLCDAGWVSYGGLCTSACATNCTLAPEPRDPDTGLRSAGLLPCFDRQPWGALSCFERRFIYGQCVDNWMLQGGFCAFTCGFCATDP